MITVVGLGPGDLDRIPEGVRTVLLDPGRTVVVRTIHHPASEQLSGLRAVVACDDLYDGSDRFEDVYASIAERVTALADDGDVVYAVPGSPLVGEFAVRRLIESDLAVELVPAESFVDAVLVEMGCDPLDRGLQLLNGHDLPRPMVLDKPTIIGHLDRPEILAEVSAEVARVLPVDARVTVLCDLGTSSRVIRDFAPDQVDAELAGLRTSMFIDSAPGGLVGAVQTMATLRTECPWDREQTHQSLVKYLVEETHELIDAISQLDEEGPDWVGYALVEDELGDVLLSVLFHAAIAAERTAFDIDDVAELMRQKLVRRHPHVFGDVEADTPSQVKQNWDEIKDVERGERRESQMDGVPAGMPSIHRASKIQNRAAKVGFDWTGPGEVVPKVREEVDELEAVLDDRDRAELELGDLLFSVVNLARHLDIDGEVALRKAVDRFEARFRTMEGEGPLDSLTLDEMNERWERAKG